MNQNRSTVDCEIIQSPIFGKSLYVQLFNTKTCPFDCIYCRFGRTTNKSLEHVKGDSADLSAVKIASSLNTYGTVEHIILAACGDPVLYSGISALVMRIKKTVQIPIVIASCGTKLWHREIQRDISTADIVLASLDAPNDKIFTRINRAHGQIPFDRYISGLILFTRSFAGKLWLVVTMIDELNTSEDTVKGIAEMIKRIGPARILLNSSEQIGVRPLQYTQDKKWLHNYSKYFGDRVTVVESELFEAKSHRE